MKYAISGSRDFPNKDLVIAVIFPLYVNNAEFLVGYDPETKQPRGVDRWVYEFLSNNLGSQLGLFCVTTYPAAWGTEGKSAGIKRNIRMIDDADRVICFWDGQSPGTRHAMRYAFNQNKLYELYIRGV